MFHNSSEVILQHESDQLLECIATTWSRRTIDQCIQEQTGQTLDGYGHMKVSAIPLIMDKYKYK